MVADGRGIMPIFDKSFVIAAVPHAIGTYLSAGILGGAAPRVVREDGLYILTENDLGFVYLIRAAPDGKSEVRLVADPEDSVKAAFGAATIKDALRTLLASPTPDPIDPTVLARISQNADALQRAFQPRRDPPPAPLPAAEVDLFLRDELLGKAPPPKKPRFTDMPDLTTLKQPQPVKSAIIPIETVLLVIGFFVVLILVILGVTFVRQQFQNAMTALTVPFSLNGVTLNYDSHWHSFPVATIPRCAQLETAGFTCNFALQNDDQTVSAILGGVPSSRSVNLTEVEADSLVALQQQLPGTQRLSVKNLKLPGGIAAIRRDMLLPVRNTDLKHYAAQVYFHYKLTLYELTIEAASQEVFTAQTKNIDALINSLVFN